MEPQWFGLYQLAPQGDQDPGPEPHGAVYMKDAVINSRLQKGGALLSDMRRLVAAWPDQADPDEPAAFVMRALGKASLARAHDTFVRAFRPRFIAGDPPRAWKLARALEDAHADPETARACYFWISMRTARKTVDDHRWKQHGGAGVML